ncbi:MAG: exopolyphosphatase [Deltaproteobacteria bacterium]|nr:exopolyphosphatase [Deltaproteobacteria bacterium]
MKKNCYSATFSRMTKPCASIDIGSHTARLLISTKSGPQGILRPLIRKRDYIRLSEGFDRSGKKIIQPDAIHRTLNVLEDFSQSLKTFDVGSVHAVATGLFREAANRDEFLDRIYESTGIRVRTITGDEEGLLTGKGVLNALNIRKGPFLIFDLGGGSTEFLSGTEGAQTVKSIPLGAGILTQAYLKSDPPEKEEIDELSRHIDQSLEEFLSEPYVKGDNLLIVGTGGTVTTLGAMLHRISVEDVTPDRITGMTLTRAQIEALFDRLRNLNLEERFDLPGLDPGRAGVILAGSLIVIRILRFFKSVQLTVSMSDLLEGILLTCFKGEGNEYE